MIWSIILIKKIRVWHSSLSQTPNKKKEEKLAWSLLCAWNWFVCLPQVLGRCFLTVMQVHFQFLSQALQKVQPVAHSCFAEAVAQERKNVSGTGASNISPTNELEDAIRSWRGAAEVWRSCCKHSRFSETYSQPGCPNKGRKYLVLKTCCVAQWVSNTKSNFSCVMIALSLPCVKFSLI